MTAANPRDEKPMPGASWVWVTPEREYACFYAAIYPGRVGTIYEVEPFGLQLDGIVPWEGTARSARVISVIGQPFAAPTDAWFNIENPEMQNYCDGTVHFIRAVNRLMGPAMKNYSDGDRTPGAYADIFRATNRIMGMKGARSAE